MSRLLLFCLVGYFIVIRSPTAMAQDRSYDQNALRLDGNFGDVSIVIGVFRGIDVAKVVERSPNAVSEAREFQRNYRPGTIALGLGLMSLGASVGVSQFHDMNRRITTGLTIATVGLITYGGGRLQKAYNALHKSLWWYNRDLK